MIAPLIALLAAPTHALTSRQGGPSLDLAAGLGFRPIPVQPALGGAASFGWWTGTYDDQFSFGKYWWVGATARIDWRPDATGLTPMIEIRRGLELIVAGIAPFVAGGPVLTLDPAGAPLGYTGRAGLMLKFRRTRFWGISARLSGGVDGIGGRVGFGGGVLFGASFARPSKEIQPPEI